MEKKKIKISKRTEIQTPFFGEYIEVNPVIKISEQKILRETYFNSLFKNNSLEIDEQFGEFMLRRGLLNEKTNIDIESITDLDEIDEIIWGDFYKTVTSSIINYSEFRESLKLSLENKLKIMQIENSAGYQVGKVIEKFSPMIDEFSSTKLEDLKSIAEILSQTVKEEPVASVIADMNGNKPKRKAKKD